MLERFENLKGQTLSEDTIQKVRRALKKLINLIDERCSETGCLCDLRGDLCSQQYTDILDEFEATAQTLNKREDNFGYNPVQG